MIDAIYNLLIADGPFMAALPGGLYTAADVVEISRQNTPAAYDANLELMPCGLLRQESATPWGPHDHSARLSVLLVLYQRFGYDSIDTARRRAYSLLHRQVVNPGDGDACYQVYHADDVLDLEAQELGASMQMSRYVAVIRRGT